MILGRDIAKEQVQKLLTAGRLISSIASSRILDASSRRI
jgi:hypothetical protein